MLRTTTLMPPCCDAVRVPLAATCKPAPTVGMAAIAITGEAVTPEIAAFLRRGHCLVLEKPLDLERLLREVRERTRAVTFPPPDRSAATSA